MVEREVKEVKRFLWVVKGGAGEENHRVYQHSRQTHPKLKKKRVNRNKKNNNHEKTSHLGCKQELLISRKPGNGVFNLASVEQVADIKPCGMQNLTVQNNKQTNKQKSNQTQHQQSGSGNSIVGDLLVLSTRYDDIYHNLGATEEISTSSEFTSVILSANLAKLPSSLSLWWTCWNPKVMQRSPLLESCSNSKKQFVCSLNFNSCLDPLKTSFVAKVKSPFLRKLPRTRGRRSRCSQTFNDCVKLSEVFVRSFRCKQEIRASSMNDLVVSI